MRKLLFATFVALLMVGCGSPDLDDKDTLHQIIAEAIDADKIQERGERGEKLFYAPNQQKPYTGWVKTMLDNGQISVLVQCKDGKRDGLQAEWYENGQKEMEGTFKDGEMDGPLARWYENGQKGAEGTFKDGKLMTAVAWKPNGEKCPVTNLVNGNGDWVAYNKDGEQIFRKTYKDGVEVED